MACAKICSDNRVKFLDQYIPFIKWVRSEMNPDRYWGTFLAAVLVLPGNQPVAMLTTDQHGFWNFLLMALRGLESVPEDKEARCHCPSHDPTGRKCCVDSDKSVFTFMFNYSESLLGFLVIQHWYKQLVRYRFGSTSMESLFGSYLLKLKIVMNFIVWFVIVFYCKYQLLTALYLAWW